MLWAMKCFSAGKAVSLWLLGILTGGAMIALATNTSEADTVGILLMLLGLGLAGLGWLSRKKTPIGGSYLALGMREVNLRGASLFQRPKGKEGEHVRGCVEGDRHPINAHARRNRGFQIPYEGGPAMVIRKLFVFFGIAVISLGLAGAGFSAGMVGDAKGIVTKIENGKVSIKDNMGETTVEPTNSEVLTELKVGDKVSVKDGKLNKEVSTGP